MNVAPVTNRTVVYPVPPVPPVQAIKRADSDDSGAKTPEAASETATSRPPQSASARQGLGTLVDIRV